MGCLRYDSAKTKTHEIAKINENKYRSIPAHEKFMCHVRQPLSSACYAKIEQRVCKFWTEEPRLVFLCPNYGGLEVHSHLSSNGLYDKKIIKRYHPKRLFKSHNKWLSVTFDAAC